MEACPRLAVGVAVDDGKAVEAGIGGEVLVERQGEGIAQNDGVRSCSLAGQFTVEDGHFVVVAGQVACGSQAFAECAVADASGYGDASRLANHVISQVGRCQRHAMRTFCRCSPCKRGHAGCVVKTQLYVGGSQRGVEADVL